MGLIVRVLVIFSPEMEVLMTIIDIDSDTSTIVPFGSTLVQVRLGVFSPVALQLRTAGEGERTSTFTGLASRMTETVKTEDRFFNRKYSINKMLVYLGVPHARHTQYKIQTNNC